MRSKHLYLSYQIKWFQHNIDCGQKIVGICWDPFDKYIFSLKFDNTVKFYKIDNWQQKFTISFQIQGKEFTTKREDRKLDQTIDCRYLAKSNLDQKTIPNVAISDRNSNFQVVRTILGPSSSINVARFSPMLFKNSNTNNEYSSLFAIGDNEGNISLWQINKKGMNGKKTLKSRRINRRYNMKLIRNSINGDNFQKIHYNYRFSNDKNERQEQLKSLFGDLKTLKFADMQFEQTNVQADFKNQIPDIKIQKREIPKQT
ncbi:unnamed protein product [Paramecium sonneborni]|uniref:Uncharacterized protein n=1 Tax=Paramecium sonneborni TaxID=65129 RepID=A0A8S1RQU0_9CILI|nr:unnamed protein product [Paramecium sonneborni]